MTYTTAEGRQQVLDVLAVAADELGSSLALLGEAYEHLDENSADAVETELFRPVQLAYGRTKRTYNEFADRYELPGRTFESAPAVAPSSGTKGLIDAAVDASVRADGALAELQDSMLPIEVGDADLRANLSGIRELVGPLRGRAREVVRTLGR